MLSKCVLNHVEGSVLLCCVVWSWLQNVIIFLEQFATMVKQLAEHVSHCSGMPHGLVR